MKTLARIETLAILVSLLLATPFATAEPLGSGLAKEGFDTKVRVQDDLFRAVNGHWLATTEIPADKSRYGVFTQLDDLSDERVRTIVDELAAKPQAGDSVEQKIAAFYRAYTDTAALDAHGLKPAEALLAEIDAIQTRHDLAQWLGRAQGISTSPISLYVMGDPKEPTINRAITWQGGLGLPDRDYYLLNDARITKARKAYEQYLTTLASLSGDPHAPATARRVMLLEQRIAKAHWDKVKNRDPVKTYNPMTLVQLSRKAPGFDWTVFTQAAALPSIDRLSVSQPSATIAIAQLLRDVPLADWKAYLRLHALDDTADVLPAAFREARFTFHGNALTGAKEDEPRWKKGIAEVNAALGEAIGQVYVARHFPAAYKDRMQQLVANLMSVYRSSIDQLAWMTPATREQAQIKLAKYVTKIGYPDQWRDYSKLEAREGDALGNRLRAGRFEWERNAAKAGKPVDRTEWGMTPQTVNAYYDGSLNEIVFPAAILQPPFFDMTADDAANYGAIGAVIGHEISHGFDDQGSQFDGDGMLRVWWTAADRKAFEALGARLATQYEKYEPIPGKHLNGKLTLGENIADLSGLQIAYKAYQASLAGKPAPVIDGFTGDQRFFMGWSQAWRGKSREERALQMLTVDPHSPEEFRANGAAVNHDGFHAAFATRPGDKMFKPVNERIRIW